MHLIHEIAKQESNLNVMDADDGKAICKTTVTYEIAVRYEIADP
jgi:hypothetical protein